MLIVGLGNPGEQFEGTRHNVGAAVVACLAARADTRLRKTKARALAAGVLMSDQRIVLSFPQTFVNNSGEAVRLLVQSYGIQEAHHIVIVHDELDLETGRLRLKAGGGLAGHNGLRSITHHLGTTEYIRLRIGVGRPPVSQSGSDWVLRRPGKADREILDDAIERAADAVEQLISEGVERTMATVNRRTPS
ncbi:MAG: aminoacyl-tRNA hydrolase [Actinomycetia bacterium]|nr:aminoacyl-tRNA hydrolase [Actinomycetes bacterium]MCP4226585.1 aminoacyl-tRNA hydrolase [Actinomycetes bacterium]MCP5030173.1 aminoacyl-tRNA hydrolase [Actinomycetes bacterium]